RDQDLSALLGSKGQRRAALQLTSLRVVRNQDTPRNVHTVLWSSTAREPKTRVPQEDSLRAVEHVAAGTTFKALLRLNQADYSPLLDRLVRRMDRLGGDRGRGSGLVKSLIRPARREGNTIPDGARTRRLRLVLRNLEPLCMPATGHPGNLIR